MRDMLFNRMYKHLNGDYQPNFNTFVKLWAMRHVPNYNSVINKD